MPAGGPSRWGFHQLADSFARQLVESAGIGPGDLVLDVGAGTGALTAPLVAAGARVVAIELHPGRCAALRRRFDADSATAGGRFDADSTRTGGRFDGDSTRRGARAVGGRVRVVRADAADLRLPRQPFKVVANPPWASSVALLRRLTAPGSRLIRADLVLPRHLAERWTSPGAPGAGRWHHHFEVAIAGAVPRSVFRPPPPQPAALLTLRRRGGT